MDKQLFRRNLRLVLLLAVQILSLIVFVSVFLVAGHVVGFNDYQSVDRDDVRMPENAKILRQVHLVCRHGDKTPSFSYPNDPYNDPKYWPDGLGELTIAGKRRSYLVGEKLRERYQALIGSNPRLVRATSSSSKRCIESAQCLLAGLLPPGHSRWEFTPKLNWQPMVIEVNDPMLRSTDPCPAADEETKRIKVS